MRGFLINEVTVRGDAVDDPEYFKTKSGDSVVNIRISVPQSWKGDQVNQFQVRAYKDIADFIYERVKQGTPVLLKGFLRQETWTSADGDLRNRVVIVAKSLIVERYGRNGYSEICRYHHSRKEASD